MGYQKCPTDVYDRASGDRSTTTIARNRITCAALEASLFTAYAPSTYGSATWWRPIRGGK